MANILLIIDLQEGFLNSGKRLSIVPVIKELCDSDKFQIIIQVRYVNSEKSFIERTLNWTKMRTKEEQALRLNIEHQIIIQKTTYSAGIDDLFTLLLPIDKVYICGLDTDTCVLATAFSLFDREHRFSVIEDAVATNSTFQQFTLDLMRRNFGEESVIRSTDILEYPDSSSIKDNINGGN